MFTPEDAIDKACEEIEHFFDTVHVEAFEKLALRLLHSNGTLHISATGPTVYVAKKVSQTLASVNVSSAFLQPIDALHGDVGNVKEGDTVLLLGDEDSEELMKLIPVLRLKKIYLVVIAAESAKSLRALSDLALVIGLKEISTDDTCFTESLLRRIDIYALIVLDTLVVRMMHGMKLSKTEYAENHPSGKIGKHLLLRVSQVLVPLQDVPVVRQSEVGIDILIKLASHSKGYGCILVVDKKMQLLGTVSDADFRRAVMNTGRKSMHMRTDELMNFKKQFPRVCRSDDLAIAALTEMNKSPTIDYMPVLDEEGVLAGLVTAKCLLDAVCMFIFSKRAR